MSESNQPLPFVQVSENDILCDDKKPIPVHVTNYPLPIIYSVKLTACNCIISAHGLINNKLNVLKTGEC